MAQELVDVGGGEGGRILGQTFLAHGVEEDGKRLPVGADGFGGLALDAAGGEVEVDQAAQALPLLNCGQRRHASSPGATYLVYIMHGRSVRARSQAMSGRIWQMFAHNLRIGA